MRRFELEHSGVGPPVDLRELLEGLPDNTLQWSILRFSGDCIPPSGLDASRFQSAIDGAATGFLLGFADLRAFANGVRRTDDCLIVAAESISRLTTSRLNRDFADCGFVIQRAGTTPWQLWIRDDAYLLDGPRRRIAHAWRIAEARPPDYPAFKVPAAEEPE